MEQITELQLRQYKGKRGCYLIRCYDSIVDGVETTIIKVGMSDDLFTRLS
jgi:hypothetical protein